MTLPATNVRITREDLVERIARAADRAYPIKTGEAVLSALHAAGFAVVPKEMPRGRDEELWRYLRPYHDIDQGDIDRSAPRDFFRLAWREELRAADLAREPQKEG